MYLFWHNESNNRILYQNLGRSCTAVGTGSCIEKIVAKKGNNTNVIGWRKIYACWLQYLGTTTWVVTYSIISLTCFLSMFIVGVDSCSSLSSLWRETPTTTHFIIVTLCTKWEYHSLLVEGLSSVFSRWFLLMVIAFSQISLPLLPG